MRLTALATGAIMTIASVTAQEKAEIAVSYDVQNWDFWQEKMVARKMTLLASPTSAKYFNEVTLWHDSLQSVPGGGDQLNEILLKNLTIGADGSITVGESMPLRKVYTYVFTDANKDALTVYDGWTATGGTFYTYDEPMGEQTWEIVSDSVGEVLGYQCVLAETDYHGRHWKAWFAPEIPVSFGPWKFRGLPGLILKAESEGGFRYEATGLGATERLMTPMYTSVYEHHEKADRKKMLETYEYEMNHIVELQEALFGTGRIDRDRDGNEVPVPTYDGYISNPETDYKKK